jgi:hypothetical protein
VSEIRSKDTDRKWSGVKRVRDVVIGETHAERKRRKRKVDLERRMRMFGPR